MVEALRKLASRRVEGLEDLPDEDIVAMCKQELPADLTAYRELLRRYEGLVYNTCQKLLGSRTDAEEVAQDALIQVFHKIHQFEGRSAFKTWLYKIVHNYCRNRISKIIRKREGQTAYEAHAADTQSDVAVPDSQLELSAHVEEALSKLKDKDREIVILKFMSGLTLQEIADVLGVGLSAAKMRLYRALDEFKKAYVRLEGDGPVTLRSEE